MPAQAASHATAVAVEQATLGPPGTVSTAARCGKWPSKMVRYQYDSLVRGVLSGYLGEGGGVVHRQKQQKVQRTCCQGTW